MKIQNFEVPNISRNIELLAKPVLQYNLSFKGEEDKFIKVEDNEFESASKRLKLRYQKLMEEANSGQYDSDIDELIGLDKRNNDMAQITEEYIIINRALSKSLQKNAPEDAKHIADFIEAMDKLGSERGFNRVSGYQEVKNRLMNEFVLEKMMISHTSQEVDVPNALLFFGLQGNGKSLFAKALAEQTMSNIETIDAAEMPEEEVMKKIIKCAENSRKEYKDSEGKKQRTIILINEAESVSASDSPVLEEFKEIAKNCSNKYKCTLFLTTNHPELIDKEILSKSITPIKIGIEPADRKTCKEIINNTLSKTGKLPEEGLDILTEEFFRNKDKYYSNGDIVTILTNTMREFDNPLVRDYIEVIKRNDTPPSITRTSLEKFRKTQAQLES